MIETKISNESPLIVYHCVSGKMSEEEATDGASKAMSIINNIVGKSLRFSLVMDMRGYLFDNLNAHRIWSIELKEQSALKENVDRVALIGDDTVKLRAEKELMESDVLKFFTELELANQWLKNV